MAKGKWTKAGLKPFKTTAAQRKRTYEIGLPRPDLDGLRMTFATAFAFLWCEVEKHLREAFSSFEKGGYVFLWERSPRRKRAVKKP
jgi:hypothetical protein